ncbi:hypothetical protein GUITHDRAFT_111082 [Guillardia theta CCMP2712]|uniref:Uncharacterized protein n=1 Tax=Guillardia theta (strain CCMP2712) TaxID=905079 RepID=L1J4I5_GUITC|nr:hypothetical protein GUITHDRAFT_111082 [Guillardia theta CCMP2712]EKX43039.1 hypothetical protein GUITHDRAFT_111082 [Guillardia theta CCMP2712]|eukprot:XP_005830019.1 hypothetical protein GUITHDRAFT_111082 [Guillardia theta CCMP2712]
MAMPSSRPLLLIMAALLILCSRMLLLLLPLVLQTLLIYTLLAPIAILVLGLLLFFGIQIHYTFKTEGMISTGWLIVTSLIIFPENESPVIVKEGEVAVLKGVVSHRRKEQAINNFDYHVNFYIIPLDSCTQFQGDHLSADQAREMAMTDGPPWGERVTFLFDPKGDNVPKTLHVSPFLDMNRAWRLEGSLPATLIPGTAKKDALHRTQFRMMPTIDLSVTCLPNCENGSPFYAFLRVKPVKAAKGISLWSSPRAYFMPQRIALRIYWQAFKLLIKGVRYCPHPREVDVAAYETLVNRPGPIVIEGSSLPSRKYIFREFEADGSKVERVTSSVISGDMDSFTKESLQEKPMISMLQYFDGKSWQQGH